MIPTVQFYSSNPRNSAINIRGLGAPFGLTNDGIEPGVGLYIDGVFYARPASATLDFLDVEQVEVLRGPQGTLFGKNTTAGAINVTTRKPSFTRETQLELNYGSLGFVQAKASTTGPTVRKGGGAAVVFRHHARRHDPKRCDPNSDVNDLNNLGLRGQLLFAPSDRMAITVAVDDYAPASRRLRPGGRGRRSHAARRRTGNTRRSPPISAYVPSSFNAFDRLTDTNTPWRSNQDLGGASVTVDRTVGPGRLTSITAWRYWNWDPSNDRDFIGLPVTTISAAPSKQRQWTQEVRYAGDVSPTRESGRWRLRVPPDARFGSVVQAGTRRGRGAVSAGAERGAATPGLLDGYGFNQSLDVSEHQRGAVRPARMVGHRSPACASRPSVQLRPEGRQFRPAGLRRTADGRSRPHRAAAVDPCAAGVQSGRRRHQHVGSDDGGLQRLQERKRLCHLRDQLQVGRPQPERRSHRRVRPADPCGRDGEARR